MKYFPQTYLITPLCYFILALQMYNCLHKNWANTSKSNEYVDENMIL